MKRIIFIMAAVILAVAFAGQTWAALYVRGTGTIVGGDGTEYKLIYDDYWDITWLDYTNNVRANWYYHTEWVNGLEVSVQGGTFNSWRLPKAFEEMVGEWGMGWSGLGEGDTYDYHYGYNMSYASEFAYLYYEYLGNVGVYNTDGSENSEYGLRNKGPFDHLIKNNYWTQTPDTVFPQYDYAWFFMMSSGGLGYLGDKPGNLFYGIAVMDGDVGAASVPLPGALWLLGSGLVGLVAMRRGRAKID